jgi:hypothetical protein
LPPNPTRFKFDVTGVESARPVLPAGVYVGKITQADITEPDGKDQRIELVVTVRESGKDFPLYEYVNLVSEDAKWKLRELLEAVGKVQDGKAEAGTLDTKRDLLGKRIGVRTIVRAANEQYDESARIRRMFDPESDSTTASEDLDVEAEAGEDLDEGEATAYDDWSLSDLRKEARSRGIKTVRMSAEQLTQALVDSDAQQEPEVEEEEPEAEAEAIDISALSIPELKALAREHGVKVAGKKAKDLRAELDALVNAPADEEDEELDEEEEELEEEAEPEEEAPADQPADDYDEWPIEDLRTEAKDRSLSDRGGQGVLIARLRRDDAEGDNPF